MKNLSVLIILFFSPNIGAYAQAPNNLAFPSPNNAFLGYIYGPAGSEKVDVDLYTGMATINLPICNLGSREISIPISLAYTGGRGIRVQDYATIAGLGWQLNAGGSISRVVRCYPDERSNGYLGTSLWGQIINNHYKNDVAWTASQKKAITGESGLPPFDPPTADGEPDIFYVKTPFFSFQFVFDEFGQPVFSNSTGFKVITSNFYNSTLYQNSSFEVIDAAGNAYYFGSSSQSKEETTTKLFSHNYTFTTTWYLDKIVSFNRKDTILFSYTSPTSNNISYHYKSNTDSSPGYASITDDTPVKSTIPAPRVINKIASSLGEIVFSYATDRRDVGNMPRLTNIVLKGYDVETGQNEALRTYGFNYGYFGDPATDPDLLRLKLNNITLKGNTPETSTPITLNEFLYNETINLPSRQDLSSVDYFGYYSHSTLSNPDKKSIPPDQAYAQANILTEVRKLGGASYKISYELNTYYNSTSETNVNVGGLRVYKLAQTLPSGDEIYSIYDYNDNNGNSTGKILSDSYGINEIESDDGITKTFSESISNYYDLNGNYVGYASVKVTNQNGGYTVMRFTNFNTGGCNDILNYTEGNQISAPVVTSSVSSAYKRGLLQSKYVYNASGDLISTDDYYYTPLTYPVLERSWAFHWQNFSFRVGGSSHYKAGYYWMPSTYWTKVEDFRLDETLHFDYDQHSHDRYIYATTDYTYAPDKRHIRSITADDSKGNSHQQTFYYANDNNIPMVTSTEQGAIQSMVNANRTNTLIHKTDNQHGAIHQQHHSYGSHSINMVDKIFLDKIQYFTDDDLQSEAIFGYDPSCSQPIMSNKDLGKPTAVRYGYHSSLPVTEIVNSFSKANTDGSHQNGFFYEGFEENASASYGNAHTGKGYWGGTSSYQVSFVPPDNRTYIIQWWKYVGGTWKMTEETYSGTKSIAGVIDDVRIFPKNARMTTYTYAPLVGKTSEIDPVGNTITYEYDGLGRLVLTRDDDGNIRSKTDYHFAD